MSAITILLVAIVALLAGMEGILDEFQFHQPLVACTLIGLVTGHLQEGILLGGSLQMMALGWANVGAAVAPDAALASAGQGQAGGSAPAAAPSAIDDARAALLSMGFSPQETDVALSGYDGQDMRVEDLLGAALKRLGMDS